MANWFHSDVSGAFDFNGIFIRDEAIQVQSSRHIKLPMKFIIPVASEFFVVVVDSVGFWYGLCTTTDVQHRMSIHTNQRPLLWVHRLRGTKFVHYKSGRDE